MEGAFIWLQCPFLYCHFELAHYGFLPPTFIALLNWGTQIAKLNHTGFIETIQYVMSALQCNHLI